MKTYDVWMEGHRATGEWGVAQFLGNAKAENFAEACDSVLRAKGMHTQYYNNDPAHLSFWGCRLFDNEADARKAFG